MSPEVEDILELARMSPKVEDILELAMMSSKVEDILELARETLDTPGEEVVAGD